MRPARGSIEVIVSAVLPEALLKPYVVTGEKFAEFLCSCCQVIMQRVVWGLCGGEEGCNELGEDCIELGVPSPTFRIV